jgi:hypothetical protein
MVNNTYKTLDIFEAAWIYSQNIKLLGLEPNGRYSYFLFDNPLASQKLSIAYWTQSATGNIKAFVNAYKTLKDLVFSRQSTL